MTIVELVDAHDGFIGISDLRAHHHFYYRCGGLDLCPCFQDHHSSSSFYGYPLSERWKKLTLQVAMGMEKIEFFWYLKKIGWLALLGYFCGAIIYILQNFLF